MRRLAALGLLSIATALALVPEADAQSLRRRGEDVIIINVRPRSFLDAGNVVAPGSISNPALSGARQAQSTLLLPPYLGQRDRFGEGTLPDPITNGPFVGAGANDLLGPVDFLAPPDFYR